MMWKFKEYGDKIAALDDTGNSVTYTQLEELSGIFRKFAYRKLIFHICRNAVGSFAGYAAMINAGVVPVMIAEDMDKALMENLWNVYQPDFIWVSSERQDQFGDGRSVYRAYGYALVDVKETTARMAYLPADKALEKAGSMGIAIPGGHFDLIDAQGKIIEEPDTVGELVYKGENVTLGYALSRSDLAKGDERGGRLETGDMAKRDSDGYYYIVGRKKRFLKMFGKRVNMDEIDCLVKEKFDGIECASTGVDDTMYIFVDNKEVIDSVHGYVAEKIHINSSAIRVKYIASIPKNESGKTLYTKLEAYYD